MITRQIATPAKLFNIDRILDVILCISIAPVPWGFVQADWFDRMALVAMLLGVGWFRFIKRRRPLSIAQFSCYLAIWFTTLDALDKFAGYGDGEYWWQAARFLAGIFIFIFIAWNTFLSANRIMVVPLLLFLAPISQVPLDIARNVIARSSGIPLEGVFVTKALDDKVYGVFFEKPTMVRYALRDEEGQMFSNDIDTTGLGSGTMPPQYPRASAWQRKLVQLLMK